MRHDPLRDVYKSFGAKEVLRGFSLDVPEGKNTVLLGFSGSGKSVTLKLVAGLLTPDSGEVLVDGKSVPDLDPDGLALLRRDIAFVFQFAALFDSMTVEENIRLGLRKQGMDDAGQRAPGQGKPGPRQPGGRRGTLSRPSCRAACGSGSGSRAQWR